MTKRDRRESKRQALNERLGAIEVGDAAGKPPARTEHLGAGRGEGFAASPSPALVIDIQVPEPIEEMSGVLIRNDGVAWPSELVRSA